MEDLSSGLHGTTWQCAQLTKGGSVTEWSRATEGAQEGGESPNNQESIAKYGTTGGI